MDFCGHTVLEKKIYAGKKKPFLSRKKISSMCLALPIQKRIPGVDWTLRYHGRAVHPRGVLLNHPVPVNGEGFIRQTVLHHYFNLSKKRLFTFIWKLKMNGLIIILKLFSKIFSFSNKPMYFKLCNGCIAKPILLIFMTT